MYFLFISFNIEILLQSFQYELSCINSLHLPESEIIMYHKISELHEFKIINFLWATLVYYLLSAQLQSYHSRKSYHLCNEISVYLH